VIQSDIKSETLLSFGKCISLASAAKSIPGLWSQVRMFGPGLGFSSFLVLDAAGLKAHESSSILVNDFERAGGASVTVADWANSDIVERCRTDGRPFLPSELGRDDRFPGQRWARAVPSSAGNGVIIPVHDDRELQAVFFFHGADIRTDAGSVALLQALAFVSHARLKELGSSGKEGPVALASEREAQCLHWLSEGLDDAEIANVLRISKRTVRFHIDNLKRKVGASRRTQILAMTYRGKRDS
jgi:DNA-binding CsgD family transcriptional regulator